MSLSSSPSRHAAQRFQALHDKLDALREELNTHIYGQKDVINQVLVGLLAGGHLLLEGVPGLAKTRLLATLGQTLSTTYNRVQCTPDLMPQDIIGTEILDENSKGKRQFQFVQGPLFTQLLMVDEINRASPRTQSALLQAMQEKAVTVLGQTYTLPDPFHVLATQNPLDQEGTYPLPEAQLDRFLLKIHVDYPSPATEREIILQTTQNTERPVASTLKADDLLEAQYFVRDMPVGESLIDMIVNLVQATRPTQCNDSFVQQYGAWGASPRAGQALMLSIRARALLDGRYAPSPADIKAMAFPVLGHRIGLTYTAQADSISTQQYIEHLCDTILPA